MHDIKLKKVADEDSYIEYNIINNGIVVGKFQTIEDDRDFIFGRQISINPNHRGNGIATQVINQYIEMHNKPFRFCIATNSEKAVSFWKYYLSKTKFHKTNIKGETWELSMGG